MRVRVFHFYETSPAAMEQIINDWFEDNPGADVKFVQQSIARRKEDIPFVIVSIFYHIVL